MSLMIKINYQNARVFIVIGKILCCNITVLCTLPAFLLLFTTKILVLCTIFPATEWRNLCRSNERICFDRCRAPKYFLSQQSERFSAAHNINIV